MLETAKDPKFREALIEKTKLVDEMKSVDDAYHAGYKEKIEAINERIR